MDTHELADMFLESIHACHGASLALKRHEEMSQLYTKSVQLVEQEILLLQKVDTPTDSQYDNEEYHQSLHLAQEKYRVAKTESEKVASLLNYTDKQLTLELNHFHQVNLFC